MTSQTRFFGNGFICALLLAMVPAMAPADLAADLQQVADGLIEDGFHGALLYVADPVQGQYSVAAGVRDTETMSVAQPTDRFRIASNSKSFTAAAILRLRDEGCLSLDDTVADLLPGYEIPSNEVITVWHLLTHTSGLPDHNNDTDYFDDAALANPSTNFAPAEVFEVVRSLPSHFAPGTDWRYCDTGYYILHLVIESANTNDWRYAEFVRQRLIEPLGLTNTFVPDAGNNFLRVIPGDHLDGYLLLDNETGEDMNVTEIGQSYDLGCGGMVSSTVDLASWIRALHDGTVLGPASQAAMETITGQARRSGNLYGMATIISPILGYGHSGVTAGYVSWMFFDPVRRTTYAVGVNIASEDLMFLPAGALGEAKGKMGYDVIEYPPMTPGTATNLVMAANESKWLTLPASAGGVYTLDLFSTNSVAAYLHNPNANYIGKALSAYGLTVTAQDNGDYLIDVVNGPVPGACQVGVYTNPLPFSRWVTDTAERPGFMSNPWYDGSAFGYVHVPANRETNDLHSYRLPVLRMPGGPDATNGPVVYLSGGPGSSAINQVMLFAQFTNTCPIIVMNQRGTYLSQPDFFPVSANETAKDLQQRLGGSDGMDFNTINTRENAADVHDVMTALGYSNPFNVWGTSYGTMLAQEVMRQRPDRIRSVVLDGVVMMDRPQWTTMAQGFHDAIAALTNNVARDADANRLYPDCGDALLDLAADLYPEDYEIVFEGLFHQMNLSRWGRVEDTPAVIWRIINGEIAALAGLGALNILIPNPPPDGPMSETMYAIMLRRDFLPFESMTDAAALTNSLPFPLNMYGYAYSQDQFDASADWDFIAPTDTSFRTAVTNDVPVLILNGQYDTQTSLRNAKHVAASLPNAYYVELPYIGHVVLFGGDVPAQIGRDFLINPSVFPATNGIAGMSLTFTPPWGTNAIPLTADGIPRTNMWTWNDIGAVGEWYEFAAVAGERFAFEVGSPEVPFTLSIVTTNADVLADGDGPSLSWSCRETGDYYAWLVGATSGTFTVTLRGITNDLVEAEAVAGHLAPAETAWFHGATVSGQYYGVWVTGVTADVSLQLVNTSHGFITNRTDGWLGWTGANDDGYDIGVSSTGDTPFVMRFYSLTNTIAVTRSAVTGAMERFNIPGVSVALVDGHGIAWIEHFGLADVARNRPVDADTVFMIGSLSKTLTTLTALQLVDENALDLDASVTNFIPEFSLLPRFAGFPTNITPRNMLDHHSGLPGDIYNGAVSPIDRYWSGYTAWLIGYFSGAYALYPPDKFASYCNSGFNIVAEIVARLDGTDFTDAAENRLFGPLGMTYSSFLPNKSTITANLATGYDGGDPSPALVMNMPATGGAFSRVEDIAKVMIVLVNAGRYQGQALWSSNALAAMDRTPARPLDVGSYSQCGLGLDSVRDPALNYGGRTWAKNGSTGSFESFMEVMPDQKLGCVVLMNASPYATYGIVRTALKAAMAEKAGLVKPVMPPMDFTPTNRPPEDLLPLAGLYVTRSGLEQFTAETNGTLTSILIGLDGSVVSTGYQALANGRFSVPGHANLQCAFTNIDGEDIIIRYGDDGGIVSEMIFDGYGEMLHGNRFVPPPVPAAWSNRVGVEWFAGNQFVNDLMILEAPANRYQLHLSNGILRIGATVLEPVDDNTAYVAGLVTRGDGAVRMLDVNGQERLQYNGDRCMRLNDIPALTPGLPISGTNLFHEGNWYVMNLASGTYTLTCNDATITMLVYHDLNDAPSAVNGEHTFVLAAPGVVYVSLVTMSDSAPYGLSAGKAALRVDRVAMHPDGYVLRWISQPGTNYTVEIATNLMEYPAFKPLTSGIPGTDKTTTTWTSVVSQTPFMLYRVRQSP